MHALCPYCDVRFPVVAAARHVTLDELADAYGVHVSACRPLPAAPSRDRRFVCSCRYDGCPSAVLEDCPVVVSPPRSSPPVLCHCTRPLPCPNHRKVA